MTNGISSYITNLIENSSAVDACADFCLAPLHGLLETVNGPKSVRVFNVTPQEVKEVAAPAAEDTLWKVIKVILFFVFFIPGTLVGICLKGAAQCDDAVAEKNALLRNHFHRQGTEGALGKVSEKNNELIPGITDDLVDNKIFLYLAPEELAKLEETSKVFWQKIHSPHAVVVAYRANFKGLPAVDATSTLHTLSLSYRDHIRRFNYDKDLITLFGGAHNILRLPLFAMEVEDPTLPRSEIEAFIEGEGFAARPSLFRLRLTKEREPRVEVIFAKYSLFVPQEELIPADCVKQTCCWLDYRRLLESEGHGWAIHDMLKLHKDDNPEYLSRRRAAEGLSLEQLAVRQTYSLFSNLALSFLNDEENGKKLKKLLSGRVVGLFNGGWERSPRYIAASERRDLSYGGRVFTDLPAVLGTVNLSYFTSRFKVVTRPTFWLGSADPVFAAGPSGSFQDVQQRLKSGNKEVTIRDTQVITFAEKPS
ncbi:MAG: hypothetical protein HYX48_03990 [Chlamydiales bacterium]|nr:hypothetical protein [Chlamydiales bacterium]